MTDNKPDYNVVWHDIRKKVIAVAVFIGAAVSIFSFADELGDLVIGNAVRYYQSPFVAKVDSIENSYNNVIAAKGVEQIIARKEFAKTMEVLTTILKGQLKKHRVEGTDKFVYETKGIYFEGYYYDGEYYYFEEHDLGDYVFIRPWAANYNSTLEVWGYVDDHGRYHKIN